MLIDKTTENYLLGKELSNGAFFNVPSDYVYERNQLLANLVKNKKVLHLGCADHVSLIAQKRKHGRYLHDLLVGSGSKVIGADVNLDALREMTALGIQDLYHIDEIPFDIDFDIVLVPDVIEHVGDVQNFLSDLQRFKCPVVVTTPNAFRIANRLQFRSELVNTDHKYWFSPYTLAKTVVDAGYEIEKFYYTDALPLRQPFRSLIKRLYPLTRDGLLVIMKSCQPI